MGNPVPPAHPSFVVLVIVRAWCLVFVTLFRIFFPRLLFIHMAPWAEEGGIDGKGGGRRKFMAGIRNGGRIMHEDCMMILRVIDE